MIIDSAGYTCAAGHEINEDSYLCSAEKGIFIVADGLGGHSDGEKASSTAIEYFEENSIGGYTNERISALLEGANVRVLNNGDGGKTTVAAAFIEKGNFIYANAGDSRVYYFRSGKIIAQTKDHSVCQASVDMGIIRPEDIRGNEDRSRLLKVLGSEENLNIKKHYEPVRMQNGDAFIVCSDGFWDYVYETEMEADLLKTDNADTWLKYMLKRHILRAQNKGDNYTVICGIIHLDESDVFEELPAAVPKKKRSIVLPAAIIGAAAIAAVCLSILLLGGSSENASGKQEIPAQPPSESVSSTEKKETETESESSVTTDNVTDETNSESESSTTTDNVTDETNSESESSVTTDNVTDETDPETEDIRNNDEGSDVSSLYITETPYESETDTAAIVSENPVTEAEDET